MIGIGRLKRSEDIEFGEAMDQTMAQLYLTARQSQKKVFLFTGCETAVGTTKLTSDLAVNFAKAGWKTILVSGSAENSGGGSRGLTAVIKNGESLKDNVERVGDGKLEWLAYGNEKESLAQLLCQDRLTELMTTLRAEYDFVFLDFPSVTVNQAACVIGTECDAAVLVAAYEKTRVENIRLAKNYLEQSGITIAGVLVNQVRKNEYKRFKKTKKLDRGMADE